MLFDLRQREPKNPRNHEISLADRGHPNRCTPTPAPFATSHLLLPSLLGARSAVYVVFFSQNTASASLESMDIFNPFITTPLTEKITTNTNTYAVQKTTERGREGHWKWRVLLAGNCVFDWGLWSSYMGMHCPAAVKDRDYWKHDGFRCRKQPGQR